MQTLTCVELLNNWRRQIVWRRTRGRGPRGIGALGYVVDGEPCDGLVEIERLQFVVVYDDEFAAGRVAIRVASYRATQIDHGVEYGGLTNARLYKDLMLSPRPGGGRLRLDLFSAATVGLALRLNGAIDRALRYPCGVARRKLRLPRLWVALPTDIANRVEGSGPEFEALCTRFGMEPQSMLRNFQREHDGYALLPLDWVSDQLDEAVTIFAELVGFPRRQTFRVAEPAADLVGYAGATSFDFYANRFRGSGSSGATVVSNALARVG